MQLLNQSPLNTYWNEWMAPNLFTYPNYPCIASAGVKGHRIKYFRMVFTICTIAYMLVESTGLYQLNEDVHFFNTGSEHCWYTTYFGTYSHIDLYMGLFTVIHLYYLYM